MRPGFARLFVLIDFHDEAQENHMVDRINFGRLTDVIELPDLIEIQTQSYRDFLQMDTPAAKRRDVGLQAVFKEVFPINSYYA